MKTCSKWQGKKKKKREGNISCTLNGVKNPSFIYIPITTPQLTNVGCQGCRKHKRDLQGCSGGEQLSGQLVLSVSKKEKNKKKCSQQGATWVRGGSFVWIMHEHARKRCSRELQGVFWQGKAHWVARVCSRCELIWHIWRQVRNLQFAQVMIGRGFF